MAINLMRLGDDTEAYQQLKTCWDNGFQDTATKNSGDMIASLTLYMNKVRQAAITREIIEVVSGAQAQ